MAVSRPPKEIVKAIQYFKGLKISITNTQIDDENSPDMLNLIPSDRGALDGRRGKINLFTSLGAGITKMLGVYRKSTGDIYVFSYGTKFYKITDLDAGTYSEVFTGMSGTRVRWFNYNDLFYFQDGTTYYQFDGTNVTTVSGKIPTIAISTPPAGGGTLFEPLNYISAGFKQQFSADGVATAYQLALSGLDATLLTATVDGVAKVETTDFTVNRTTGVVTFTVAPPETTPDNVIITAYKTFTGNQSEIFNCTINYIWGGSDGSRIWLTGNSNFPNRDYVSAVKDPTYFPVTGFDDIGNKDSPIKGYSQLYNTLIILTKREIFLRRAVEFDGETAYITERLNGGVGCIATDSIQILDNYPTFISKKGVYQVISTDAQNERNIRHISDDIDTNVNVLSVEGLLDMGNLENYVSIDFNNKYFLFNPSNGIVWLYDYRYIIDDGLLGQWFKLDNLYAECVLEIDSSLYFGDSRKGMVNRLMNKEDSNSYSDVEDGELTAIYKYWTSKIFNHDSLINLKLVAKIFYTMKPGSKSSGDLYTRNDLRSVWKYVKTLTVSLFQYSLLEYSTFTYGGSEFPKETRAKVKAKKINYHQIKIENNKTSEAFGLLNVAIKYQTQREVK
jgi:hypothetical protein